MPTRPLRRESSPAKLECLRVAPLCSLPVLPSRPGRASRNPGSGLGEHSTRPRDPLPLWEVTALRVGTLAALDCGAPAGSTEDSPGAGEGQGVRTRGSRREGAETVGSVGVLLLQLSRGPFPGSSR